MALFHSLSPHSHSHSALSGSCRAHGPLSGALIARPLLGSCPTRKAVRCASRRDHTLRSYARALRNLSCCYERRSRARCQHEALADRPKQCATNQTGTPNLSAAVRKTNTPNFVRLSNPPVYVASLCNLTGLRSLPALRELRRTPLMGPKGSPERPGAPGESSVRPLGRPAARPPMGLGLSRPSLPRP